jgi:hypothetical protein
MGSTYLPRLITSLRIVKRLRNVKKSLQELVFHPAVKNKLPVEALAAMYNHMKTSKNKPEDTLVQNSFRIHSF